MKVKKINSYISSIFNEDNFINNYIHHSHSNISSENYVPLNSIEKSNNSLYTSISSNSFILLIRTITKNIIIHYDLSKNDFNIFINLMNQLSYMEIKSVKHIYIIFGENIKLYKEFYEKFIEFLYETNLYYKTCFMNDYNSTNYQFIGIDGEIFFKPFSRL